MAWVMVFVVSGAWIAGAVWAMLRLRSVQAGAVIFVSGYALLPVESVAGVPLKAALMSLTGLALVAVAVKGGKRALPALGWWDVPMAGWLAVQLAAEIANGRPAGDGAVVALDFLATWMVPYVVGRVVLREFGDFREVGRVLVWMGLLLLPLALYESFAQPHVPPVHQLLFGAPLMGNDRPVHLLLNRWGPEAYRPALFFGGTQPEIAAAFFFAAAALTQGWLMFATSGAGAGGAGGSGGALSRRKWDLIALLLLLAAVFNARVLTALILLVLGVGCLWAAGLLRSRVILLLLLAALPVYIATRTGGILKVPPLINGQYADPIGKNQSLGFRWYQEDMVRHFIHDAPLLGYGSYVRNEWFHTGFEKLEIVDAYWVWLLLRTGGLGLVVALQAMLIPLGGAIWALPWKRLRSAEIAGIAAILTVLLLHMVDWAVNANLSPLWAFCLGGTASVAFGRVEVEVLVAKGTR